MSEIRKPESTTELPTSSVEGFSRFILEDREGTINTSHLYTIFIMKHNRMIRDGLLPGRDSLSESQIEFLQGKTQMVVEDMYEMLGIDEMGDWAANFETQEEIEEFVEDVSDQFAHLLQSRLKEENYG